MGLSGEAQAQAQIMPTGPLWVTVSKAFNADKFYPGRTMGGGPRILRLNPPPSSLKRREE
jgi:hypothetical protein